MSAKGGNRQRLGSVAASFGRFRAAFTVLTAAALGWACSGAAIGRAPPTSAPHESPIVASQPGAWFDAQGNLLVVGAGRRLRLVLSAPIAACPPAFDAPGASADVATRASIPFHVLNEECRATHPSILLPEESRTASPAELERSYHELARCAVNDWSLTEGWIPEVVAQSDPCPLALGLGWRLPQVAELHGLTLDDRKAVAGALFDVDSRPGFGDLLLYAREAGGGLALATLSPNAAEVPPDLTPDKRRRPFFGATLRCTRDTDAALDAQPRFPVLPGASACLREQKRKESATPNAIVPSTPAELQKLKAWLRLAETTSSLLRTDAGLKELSSLLSSPGLDELAARARDERALTERYAELAEGLDAPDATPGERERRQAEFAQLRKRLGGRLVTLAEGVGRQPGELLAVLTRLRTLLDAAAAQVKPTKQGRGLNYAPLVARIDELKREKTSTP